MFDVTVHVTENDILSGWKSVCERCPVALAIARALDVDYVSVGCSSFISHGHKQGEKTYRNEYFPMVVIDFIMSFDKGEAVSPFSFILTVKEQND